MVALTKPKKSKPIDSPLRFAAWLNDRFDEVQAGNADNPAVLRDAAINAIRVGADDSIAVCESTQIETLRALGKLLTWCRSQEAFVWSFERACEELQISPNTLANVTKEGEIPFRRLGSQFRFSAAALRNWFAGQQISA